MNLYRFFAENLSPEIIPLDSEQSKHAAKVLRLKKGEPVILFDGNGIEARGIIAQTGRMVMVKIEERKKVDRELPVEITCAAAIPKGKKSHFLIQKLCELGAARFMPLRCQRSVVEMREEKIEKMKKIAKEACKQCGRNRIMEITNTMDFKKAVTTFMGDHAITIGKNAPLLFIASPDAKQGLISLFSDSSKQTSIIFLIGPEGGFTEEEMTYAVKNGFVLFSLGKTILRTETAAISAMAVIAQISLFTQKGSYCIFSKP